MPLSINNKGEVRRNRIRNGDLKSEAILAHKYLAPQLFIGNVDDENDLCVWGNTIGSMENKPSKDITETHI
jgi:hypothetical protein